MNIALLHFIILCLSSEDGTPSPPPATPAAPAEKPAQSETKVIEIKVKNDPNPTDKPVNTIKVEEVKPNSVQAPETPKPKEDTIATITVNIPNQNDQRIQIKNVENLPEKADKGPKIPVQDDDSDPNPSFIQKIVRFIRNDFRFLVKLGAVLSTALTQMIPLNLLLTIRKNKSTRNLKSLNFITSAVSSMLWSLYGTLTKNIIIIVSNFPGAIINLVGIWMFAKYCSDQSQRFILNVSSKISVGLGVLLFILFLFLDPSTFLTVVGLFGGSLLAISYVSPLVSFNEILESRNTSTMPTEISLGNFISAFFMFCYGFIIWDLLVIAPSFLGVISGLIQLTLLFLFPHTDRIIISEVEILEQPNNFKSMLTIDEEV